MLSEKHSSILCENVNYFFGKGDGRKQVLFDISLNINPAELVVLMGASGSGKTTLLTLLGCLRSCQTGTIRILNHDLLGADETTLMYLRSRFGFIFQAHNLHDSLTAIQNVQMGLAVHGKSVLQNWYEPCAHILNLLGLDQRLDYLPANLSGGQKQRVAIARALVSQPDVVFADEPTAALDKTSSIEVMALLRNIVDKKSTTVVMVTHDNRILDFADRIITLEDGKLINQFNQP